MEVYFAYDLGESWLFEGENKDIVIVYGKQGITIDKKNGELKVFYLPDEEKVQTVR
ncbi:MAG: hypothetical protein PUG71_07565 [bacterium]|nr:hypothetical protein [bacterium]